MNTNLLTKVVCLGGFGCTGFGALIYHTFKGNHTLEYLQNQQLKEQNIEGLTAENENLKSQLGSASFGVSIVLECETRSYEHENLDWNQNENVVVSCESKD